MTPEQVREIVVGEIGSGWGLSNIQGMDLRRCLLNPPRRRTYLDSFNANAPKELWVVLEEDPDGHRGYEIVFDESGMQFGLATRGFKDGRPVLIGWYGGFLDTLESM